MTIQILPQSCLLLAPSSKLEKSEWPSFFSVEGACREKGSREARNGWATDVISNENYNRTFLFLKNNIKKQFKKRIWKVHSFLSH